MSATKIYIIDFGSQYTHLIRRSISELLVDAVVISPRTNLSKMSDLAGIILSGGPNSVYDPNSPTVDKEIFSLNKPILGICYGHQLMTHVLGGKVLRGTKAEYGKSVLKISERSDLFESLNRSEIVWMSHGDEVKSLPEGFRVIASTEQCPFAAIGNVEKKQYGIQFHPEVEHTPNGMKLLKNFVFDICGCKPTLDIKNTIQEITDQIQEEIGDRNVFLMVSGGIDSTVAFLLLSKALGQDKVYGLHVDTGLLREGETKKITKSLHEFGLKNFHIINASDEFLGKLKSITDPEEKRHCIAKTYLEVKDTAMSKLNLDPSIWLLGQGTIYPDLIASGVTEHSHNIKTHHNSLLKERADFTIVEPLKLLYKDEVRKIALEFGLPEDFVWKEPFPGPGLSLRILGEVTDRKLSIQRQVDTIIEECLIKTKWYRDLWHRFPVLAIVSDFEPPKLKGSVLGNYTEERASTAEKACEIVQAELEKNNVQYDYLKGIILPLRAVGIKGDTRSYEAPFNIIISKDDEWLRLDWKIIEQISFRITSEVPGINRVVFDVTPYSKINNINVLAFLRLITSRDAMTADWAKLEFELMEEISNRIIKETDIDRVMLDVTQKPPAMMEWV